MLTGRTSSFENPTRLFSSAEVQNEDNDEASTAASRPAPDRVIHASLPSAVFAGQEDLKAEEQKRRKLSDVCPIKYTYDVCDFSLYPHLLTIGSVYSVIVGSYI